MESLKENLSITIVSNLRATKNPWKRAYCNVTDFERNYLEIELGINGRFKESFDLFKMLEIKTIRFFPNNTSIRIKPNNLLVKFTRKKTLKYYENENLTLKHIKEKNNRISVKFLVEREIN